VSIGKTIQNWFENQNVECHYFESIESSNQVAKDHASTQSLAGPCFFVADFQTQGRGRGQNTWESNPNQSLLGSWLIPLSKAPQHLTAPLLGLATYDSAKKVWPALAWSIKAPNDIYLKDKKIAGLLVETVSQADKQALVFGLGFNLFGHPTDIENSTHLNSELGLDGQLRPDGFLPFLAELNKQILLRLQSFYSNKLSAKVCEDLKQALNNNPNLEEDVVKVDEEGNIHFKNKQVNWTEL